MKLRKDIVVVGQGPNQASWLESLALAKKHKVDEVEFAVRRGRHLALTGAAGLKLAAMLGLHRLEFLAGVERHNLNDKWNGKAGKGDKFDGVEALEKAGRLASKFCGRRFVLLGKAVAASFGMPRDPEFLDVINAPDGSQFLIFPHPSGINTFWNDRARAEEARTKLREFCLES